MNQQDMKWLDIQLGESISSNNLNPFGKNRWKNLKLNVGLINIHIWTQPTNKENITQVYWMRLKIQNKKGKILSHISLEECYIAMIMLIMVNL